MILDAMVGLEVQQVCFGGPTILRMWPGGELSIEGTLALFDVVSDAIVEPLDLMNARLVSLVGSRVAFAEIEPSGDLKVRFECGTVLTVFVEGEYEAYDITLATSPSKIIGGENGRLEFWD